MVYGTQKGSANLCLTGDRPDSSPLFAGFPLVESESNPTLDGVWNFHAEVTGGGGPLDFSLAFSTHGAAVRVGRPGESLTGSGRVESTKLTLAWTNRDSTFALEGTLSGRTLKGDWRENSGLVTGTWSASKTVQTPPERCSPALVVSREYTKRDGGYDYSIGSDPPPDCSKEGRPICRVWKVPGSVLTLDWKAKPAFSRTADKQSER